MAQVREQCQIDNRQQGQRNSIPVPNSIPVHVSISPSNRSFAKDYR